MGLFDFGKSWVGVVFNPAGYIAQRKSPAEAAAEYGKNNPPTALINSDDTEVTFYEDRANWINGCANQLKSDDVGKSRANSLSACQGFFDSHSGVVSIRENLSKRIDAAQKDMQRNTLLVIGGIAFALLIIYLLFSK